MKAALLFNRIPYPAKGDRSYSKVRGDIMLRHPPYDMRFFPEQVKVPLPGCIPDKRHEVSHIVELSFQHNVHQLRLGVGCFINVFYNDLPIPFMHPMQYAWLNGFDRTHTGNIFPEALNRRDTFLLKEKLESHIFAFIIKPGPEAPLFNKICFFGKLPFPQQDRFSGHFQSMVIPGIFIELVSYSWEKPGYLVKRHNNQIK